ncbi:sugar kinase [Phenylobacterium sp.]|uniref:sugar kinase n=1 Tax=Phenylobacterium sp. TaxID=1871053 RepID=UPI002E321C36|nr:sugar kinase [Phenylobacterium sp.]HEX4709427.1 sugar kinase [Phenylobacterium sp.]
MAGVISLGECMVELSLTGPGAAQVGYAGDTFNTAVYLQRLGRQTAYATALGEGDPFSRAILARMAEEGLSRDLVVEVEGRLPGLYAIERAANGERSFYYWRGEAPARDYFGLADLAGLGAAMGGAELVYLSAISLAVIGEAGRAVLLPLLAKAAEAGVAVAFDTNYRARLWPGPELAGAAIRAAIGISRYVSASTADVAAFEGDDPQAMAAAWAANGVEVVLRDDDGRIEVLSGTEVERFAPEQAVPVVDTTGAGDAFNAGYLAARLAGRGVRDAVAAARRLAGVVVQHPGAIIPRTAMPE